MVTARVEIWMLINFNEEKIEAVIEQKVKAKELKMVVLRCAKEILLKKFNFNLKMMKFN